MNKKLKIGLLFLTISLTTGFILPEKLIIPVKDATRKDWNHNTFWYEPWGTSGVHKGIDIFSSSGKSVLSSSYGLVLYKGYIKKGGNVVAILGPKWRIHYYAHLDKINEDLGLFVSTAEKLGGVGNSGNAKNKPPHLHYTIITLLPYFWRVDTSTQGLKKMFFLNPGEKLLADHR